ncbi:transmembrane protein 165-like [Eriocheir sinensis]|uniref:transmembrane protein 165-like n=1 Tax=Eriocheir sinensis TaxID=95602 RepID=UPI0021C977A9|nr:transmembrane protein 165-like [Eriocheir sinensis]XP_050710927.1 transmembrane protein 165-like [Eriocheir sinensis]XP_050710928.1 transmembrane protein 165-like [Eriocheir sinensis]XP_050710929.1 transmembrane protein 165-like [Eriocheir sinensis]XP_050710930.1 transmembrane protein 165-like [Eriocheir sinensis]
MMSRPVWVLTLTALVVGVAWAEIHPIDVEPVMRREQPDFEDDTGIGAVLPSGSGDQSPNSSSDKDDKKVVDASFTNAFVAALSMIVVTELGDKTFFIAAIMAMNHARVTVFAGAMLALTVMHILSSFFGYVITWIPRVYTFYASSALFAIFGIKMLREGWKMKPDEGQEEMEEVQLDLRRRDDEIERETMEEGEGRTNSRRATRKSRLQALVPRVFLQALTMTFLAEWGDRSQIATVVMAAREDVYGVVLGGLLGHFLCTGLAVVGGRMIASRISVRTVTIIGGLTFLVFAVSALILGP